MAESNLFNGLNIFFISGAFNLKAYVNFYDVMGNLPIPKTSSWGLNRIVCLKTSHPAHHLNSIYSRASINRDG